MKKTNVVLVSVFALLASALAQQTNLIPIVMTGTHTNISISSAYITIPGASITNQPYTASNPMYLQIGDTIPVAFNKVNSNEQWLASQIGIGPTNAVIGTNYVYYWSGLRPTTYTPTNMTDTTLAMGSTFGIVGILAWDTNNIYIGVRSNQWTSVPLAPNTNTIQVQQFSNSVLSSQLYTLLSTNPIVFTGSNYIGTFPQLYYCDLKVPQIYGGATDPGTPLQEAIYFSTNGGSSWYSNTVDYPNLTNSVMVSVVGQSSATPGALTVYGVDHPELLGRSNAMYGQTFAFGTPVLSSDPVTLSYLSGYPVSVLANTVGLGYGWSLGGTNNYGTNHVFFGAYGLNTLDLAAIVAFVKIDSISLDSTRTNILLQIAVSNYTAGAFVETTTNLNSTFLQWSTTAAYGSVTNAGEITFSNHITTSVGVQFWRARGNAISTVTSGPVTLTGSGLKETFYTPTNSSDITLGNLVNLIRFDTNYVYIGVNSNQWKRAALTTF